MKTEVIQLSTNENVTLTTYLLDHSPMMPNTQSRPAVMVLPGGGYRMLSDREAEPIAMAFLAAGYHAFVLRYSINENAVFPKPLNDAEEALSLIREKADEWGVIPDQIAVCGFSAGGHLTAALGTMGRIRPNAIMLGYAVTSERKLKVLDKVIPSLEQEVDAQTPPAFIFATADDPVVPIGNSLRFAAALDEAKIPFEMHIFQSGRHGLALGNGVTSSGSADMMSSDFAKWVDLGIVWLENLFGGFPVDEPEAN